MKYLATFVVFTLMLVCMGVLTRKEAGLVREDVLWSRSRVPLKVNATSYGTDGGARVEATKAVQNAVRDVNARLGFQALRFVQGEADIDVVVGVPQQGASQTWTFAEIAVTEAGGYYRLQGDPKKREWVKCQMSTWNTGTFVLGLVLEHEFGHCLGLAHDDFEASIMYPVRRETEFGLAPRFSDFDRLLLRKHYYRTSSSFFPFGG